jgi:hypothetical protein
MEHLISRLAVVVAEAAVAVGAMVVLAVVAAAAVVAVEAVAAVAVKVQRRACCRPHLVVGVPGSRLVLPCSAQVELEGALAVQDAMGKEAPLSTSPHQRHQVHCSPVRVTAVPWLPPGPRPRHPATTVVTPHPSRVLAQVVCQRHPVTPSTPLPAGSVHPPCLTPWLTWGGHPSPTFPTTRAWCA